MFITFEGIDGAGKSFQSLRLSAWLKQRGYRVRLTETSDTQLGSMLMMTTRNLTLTPQAEAMLFLTARVELVNRVINPTLARGDIVICDRYSDSTLAYQGYGLGVEIPLIKLPQPDLTFYLDITPELALSRKDNKDRIEQRGLEFFNRVQAGYQAMIQAEPKRWRVIDAAMSSDDVAGRIIEEVTKWITVRN